MHASMRRLLPVVSLFLAAACTQPPSATAEATDPPSGTRSAATPAVAPSADPATAAALPNFAALVEAYGPAVVNVSTVSGGRQARRGIPDLPPDNPLNEFFRYFGDPRIETPLLYEVVGGDLGTWRTLGLAAATSCVKGDLLAATWLDPRPAGAPGEAQFYKVRARSVCGAGSFGPDAAAIETLDCTGF